MASEDGQATIEWVAIITLVAMVLGALVAFVPVVDGRSFGGFLTARVVCAVRGGGCGDGALRDAYGGRDAELVRRNAPGMVYEPGERQLPVDFRRCRAVACARAPDDRDLDTHRSDRGQRTTVFTRVVRRGRLTYVQYWFYYPDSNSTVLASDRIWKGVVAGLGLIRPEVRRLHGYPFRYPGFHEDDWEGYEVRVGPGGVDSRATTHGGLQWCKWKECRGRFGPSTGWTRVSRGSHSGHIPLERTARVRSPEAIRRDRGHVRDGVEHGYRPQIPGVNLRERTSTPDGIVLVPLETLDHRRYRRRGKDVSPPWEKRLYRHPEDGSS